jgi:RNase P subunit RPR2
MGITEQLSRHNPRLSTKECLTLLLIIAGRRALAIPASIHSVADNSCTALLVTALPCRATTRSGLPE